jgi:Dockerin type I domain
MMQKLTKISGLLVLAGVASMASAQIFSDSCDSLTNWQVNKFADSFAATDSSATVVNYGAMTVGATTYNLVEAPRSVGGTATTGILMEVNKDANAAITGINLLAQAGSLPIDVQNDGYVLSFDMYIKAPDPVTTAGSTQAFDFGVGRTTLTNTFGWFNRTTLGNGTWITGATEGGINGFDYRSYKGTLLADGLDVSSPIAGAAFPGTGYDYTSAPSGGWTRVDMFVEGTNVTVKYNDQTFHSVTGATATKGNIWIGYDDPFSSICALPDQSFMLVDNVKATALNAISGTVAVGSFSGDYTLQTFTAKIYDATNTLVETKSFKTNAAGDFTIYTAQTGTVSILTSGVTTLVRKTSGVTPGGANVGTIDLLNGDIADDGVIDLTDYTVVATYFNALASDANWDVVQSDGFKPKQADVTGDGVVDLTDYTVVAVNFNALNDAP